MPNYSKILRYLTLLIGILVRGDVDFILHKNLRQLRILRISPAVDRQVAEIFIV